MGMGMKSLKWEGIGTKNLFPHTSTRHYARILLQRQYAANTISAAELPMSAIGNWRIIEIMTGLVNHHHRQVYVYVYTHTRLHLHSLTTPAKLTHWLYYLHSLRNVTSLTSVLIGPCSPALLESYSHKCAYCCIIWQIKNDDELVDNRDTMYS